MTSPRVNLVMQARAAERHRLATQTPRETHPAEWAEGQTAYAQGKPLSADPYRAFGVMLREHWAWDEGWFATLRQAEGLTRQTLPRARLIA